MFKNVTDRDVSVSDTINQGNPSVILDLENSKFKGTNGYSPIKIMASLLENPTSLVSLAFEMANSNETVNALGVEIKKGKKKIIGHISTSDPAVPKKNEGFSYNWVATGFTLSGSATISSNVFTIKNISMGKFNFQVIANNDLSNLNLLRIRKKFATNVAAEVIDVGATGQSEYSGKFVNTPIAPHSVKITYTSGAVVHTDEIVDDGFGKFKNKSVLGILTNSYINYLTGEWKITFDSSFLPDNGVDIEADYEASTSVDVLKDEWRIVAETPVFV